MLSLITDRFEVIVADIDERAIERRIEEEGMQTLKVSEYLAEVKAKAVLDQLDEGEGRNAIVIGADTSVILGDTIFGKPEDRDDAVRMLSAMSGRAHVVATGVALLTADTKRVFTVETEVEFNAFDEYQENLISEYCDGRSPYDKAGSYGIQDKGVLLIKEIRGDYSNVVGLPVARLARELSDMVK